MLKYTLKRAFSVITGRLASVLDPEKIAPHISDEGFSESGQRESAASENPPDQLDRRSECLKILELTSGASQADIKKAYRRLCSQYHPDRFANDPEKLKISNDLFARINEAYDYLK